MKKIIVTIVIILISIAAFAIDVPQKVKDAFSKKFPAAQNVKWDKENAHEYEAEFTIDGNKSSANFSDKGEWLETESTVAFTLLPAKVKEAYNKAHNGIEVKAAARIETSKGITKYEIEYKAGKKTKEEVYNENGTIIK
jgi:hypothetical protein